jgi:hypothetical protein
VAYISYGQATVGGKQMAELMASLQGNADKLRDFVGWVGEIGVPNLDTNSDFSVLTADKQAFNDTLAQINADMVTFMATNRAKIERLARGS